MAYLLTGVGGDILADKSGNLLTDYLPTQGVPPPPPPPPPTGGHGKKKLSVQRQ